MTSVCQEKSTYSSSEFMEPGRGNCKKHMYMVTVEVMCVVGSGKESQNAVTNTSLGVGTFITPIYYESSLEFRVSVLYLRLSAF